MISKIRSLRSGFFGIGAAVSIGAFVALGCGGDQSEPSEASPGAEPAAPAESPAAVNAFDEIWMAALPEDFPPDIPLYPEAVVVKALSTPDSGLKVNWSTSDDPATVASFFSDSLAGQGWSTQRVDGADGILVFADKGARSASFGIGGGEGKTTIDLLLVEMR